MPTPKKAAPKKTPAKAAPKTAARKKDAAKKPAARKPAAKAEASVTVTIAAPIPETTLLPHNLIKPSSLNPRKTVREGYVEELAESLKATGQMQNISVRPIGRTPNTSKAKAQAPAAEGGGTAQSNAQYEIIYGEQRWQAFRLLIERGDLPADHPVLCRVMQVDDAQHLELAILENQAREDVHPLEQAEAYARLADIRRKEFGDDTAATRAIAERTGQTMRNVQYYLQVSAKLTDKAKAAWRAGDIRSRKIAIELARWPADVQDDMLLGIDEVADPADLRRWIEMDAPAASAARFSLTDYIDQGGIIVPGEDGEEDRLASPGLAAKLQKEWAEAEVARITAENGYGLKPFAVANAHQTDWHPWAKPPKGTPKSIQGVRWHLDPRKLQLKITHPVYDISKAAAATMTAALAPREGEVPLEDLPQPYSRRNWIAGAVARTSVVRNYIATYGGAHAAMAVALMSLLPKQNWFAPLCPLRFEGHTGDAGEVSRSARAAPQKSVAALAGRPGFALPEEDEDEDDFGISDPDAALDTLMGLTFEDLSAIFCEVIAGQCVDAGVTIFPGAKPETRRLIAGTQGGGIVELCTSDWLKAYTTPQLMALAEESGAADAMRAAGKTVAANKSWLVTELPAFIPPDYTPPEARILSREDAEQAAARMLARRPGGAS